MKTRKHGTGSVWTKPTLNNWYISFYRDGVQHQINTKIPKAGKDEEETAANRKAAEEMLQQEVAKKVLDIKSDVLGLRKLKYEDLRDHLIEKLTRDHKASVYVGKDGKNKLVGSKWLDKYFEGMALDKMADKVSGYPSWVQAQPEIKEQWNARFEKEVLFWMHTKQYPRKTAEREAKRIADAARDASINRSLSTLRSMYGRYHSAFPKQVSKGDIPPMPRIENADNVGQGFVTPDVYEKILAELPEKVRPIIQFMYCTGMRSGAAKQITWSMVNAQTTEISIPAGLMKNKEPWTIPLVGPLEPIRETLKRGFRTADMPVFNSENLRRVWNKACAKLGLGILDPETQNYHGLHPHDLRRSASRNLIRAGVSQTVAMKITGHKSPKMFQRYNISDQSDVMDALIKVGQHHQTAKQATK